MKRTRTSLAFIIFSCLWLSSALPSQAASSVQIDTVASATVITSGMVHEHDVYTVTNLTGNSYLSAYSITVPVKTLSNLSVASAGKNVTVASKATESKDGDITYSVTQLDLSFPTHVVGLKKKWQFTVDYDTPDLLADKGGVTTLSLPRIIFSADSGDYTLSVSAPSALGRAHFVPGKPARLIANGNTQTATFSRAQVAASSIEVSYGDASTYHLNFKFPVRNPYPFWNTITVTLPPTLPTQEIEINSVTPAPRSVTVDPDGNILMSFLLNPLQSLTVNTEVSAKVKILEYDLSLSGVRSDIPADLVSKYTKTQMYWEAGASTIKDSAAKHYDDSKTVVDNVRSLYRYTIDTLSYNDAKIKFNVRQGALEALANPTNAVCIEYADFLIAHLRAVGIPARNPIGYAYARGLKTSSDVADSLHSWVEVYIPNVGWVDIDPTWGEKIDNFGSDELTTDSDHLAFALYGVSSTGPAAIATGGHDLGYQYENTDLKYGADTPAAPAAALRVTNIPLPFFVLTKVTAENRGNVSIADLTLGATGVSVIPASNVDLGDSAPYQKSEYYFVPRPGTGRELALNLTGTGTDGASLTLANSTTVIPFAISLAEGIVLVAAVGVLSALRIRKHWRQRQAKV